MEKKPIKFYGVSLHFSRIYEVAKFWMVKLYLDVTSYTQTNMQNMLIVAYL